MQIVEMNISDLIHAPYNPRKRLKPGDREYEKLKKSISEFGYVDPVIWNSRTRNVVGGHQRLIVLQDLGQTKCQVSVVDLPEDKEKALNLALNKISGEWDLPMLKDLLVELDTGNFDIELTGFDEDEIRDLMTQVGGQPEVAEDDFDAQAEADKIVEPITKTGDVWLLGKHRVMCGDSTKKEDVGRLMGSLRANMVFTDPPYNVDYGSSKNPRHKIRKIQNDSMADDAWISFNQAIIENIKAYYSGGDCYVWGASGPDGMRQRLLFIDNGFHWSATIIWKKQQLVLSPAKYQRMYEPCFYGWTEKSTFWADRKQTEVWMFDRPLNSKLHPTMKPISVCGYGIENSSKPEDCVLDLFLGSGSTLLACEQLGRICYGMEIDPIYCDVIVKRWEEFTGKKAELLRDERQETNTIETAPTPGRKKKNAPAPKQ